MRACFLLFLAVAATPGGLLAQTTEQRISELEIAVQRLENEVFGGQLKQQQNNQVIHHGWRSLRRWEMIKKGMSSDQVISILGQPTSIDRALNFVTLFYQGNITGAGRVTGLVKLSDDRVWKVEPPVY